ncbi:MAG: DDE-type integrase/transposase/recombinase [Myxococcota bacterium]|nr:DDE-type integrase/transposase/recombinase [Myxococcota bacterium]
MDVDTGMTEHKAKKPRLVGVLAGLDIGTSRWYYKPKPPSERKPPKRLALTVPVEITAAVIQMAEDNPWYGYKRIGVMCRRSGVEVTNRQAYRVMKNNGLLQRRMKGKPAELHQAQKLYELLPQGPNELWQTDVTYIHLPGFGWWYAVTVIDYYSRYLLALRLTWSYCAAEVIKALEAAREVAERLTGPVKKSPFLVTDNGTSFMAKRFRKYVSEDFSHVRIRYQTPTQLGLLERFHRTLKQEEVYFREYLNPGHARESLLSFKDRYNNKRPHWALIPEVGGEPHTPFEVYVEGARTQIPKWQGWAKGAKEKLERMMKEAS